MNTCADCGTTRTFYRLCNRCWQEWRLAVFRRHLDTALGRIVAEL